MKCSRQKKHTAVDLSELIKLIMPPEAETRSSHVSLESISLDGRNGGATMITRCSSRSSGESSDCCCGVNIYINNNVQGVNNSILVESEVNMGDLGVSFSFRDVKLGRRSLGAKKKRGKSDLGFSWVLIAIFALILLFLSLV